VALQVANLAPKYLRREDVPEAEVQEEREALRRRALEEGRKENIIEKIIDGRMDKYFEEICLLEQKFIKDDEKTIAQMLSTAVAELGESIQISRFARFAIGESTADES
jgi:elongation factor Ts